MELHSYINSKCPVGVPHSHCSGKPTNRTGCVLCAPYNIYMGKCDNYFRTHRVFLEEEKKYILNRCLDFYPIYIPPEIREIIIGFADTIVHILLDIRLDGAGIDHMMSCHICSHKFISWLDGHSCSDHVLPRIRDYTVDDLNIDNMTI
tara:strand:+ start:460 stop:903 length:444 start_codon:yes stop_codon:yes gene_type:complete